MRALPLLLLLAAASDAKVPLLRGPNGRGKNGLLNPSRPNRLPESGAGRDTTLSDTSAYAPSVAESASDAPVADEYGYPVEDNDYSNDSEPAPLDNSTSNDGLIPDDPYDTSSTDTYMDGYATSGDGYNTTVDDPYDTPTEAQSDTPAEDPSNTPVDDPSDTSAEVIGDTASSDSQTPFNSTASPSESQRPPSFTYTPMNITHPKPTGQIGPPTAPANSTASTPPVSTPSTSDPPTADTPEMKSEDWLCDETKANKPRQCTPLMNKVKANMKAMKDKLVNETTGTSQAFCEGECCISWDSPLGDDDMTWGMLMKYWTKSRHKAHCGPSKAVTYIDNLTSRAVCVGSPNFACEYKMPDYPKYIEDPPVGQDQICPLGCKLNLYVSQQGVDAWAVGGSGRGENAGSVDKPGDYFDVQSFIGASLNSSRGCFGRTCGPEDYQYSTPTFKFSCDEKKKCHPKGPRNSVGEQNMWIRYKLTGSLNIVAADHLIDVVLAAVKATTSKDINTLWVKGDVYTGGRAKKIWNQSLPYFFSASLTQTSSAGHAFVGGLEVELGTCMKEEPQPKFDLGCFFAQAGSALASALVPFAGFASPLASLACGAGKQDGSVDIPYCSSS